MKDDAVEKPIMINNTSQHDTLYHTTRRQQIMIHNTREYKHTK